MIWETLKVDNDYEICTSYPYQIRRKNNGYIISEWENTKLKYIQIKLNGTKCYKHLVVALQWVENDDPENKTEVDHINHNRTDYHILNLRWVTSSQNAFNRLSFKSVVYEYVDTIPDESIVVDFYKTRNGMRYFDENRYYYYYDEETNEDIFYNKITDDFYKILHINTTKSGSRQVKMHDIDNKQVGVYIHIFKRQHDL